jgi:voltage-gated potassium channel
MEVNRGLENKNDKLGILNIIVIVLSIYVLCALIIDTTFVLPIETSRLLNYIDIVICIFFFVEFWIRFFKSENKLRFMAWGWIDLVSSIPMIGVLRFGRIFRLIRLFRIIRAFRSTKKLVHHLFKNRAQGAFVSVFSIAILLVIFCSIGILQVETDPNSNIKTAEDAIWWAYVTITTVGYGDKFPVTTEGRMIAAVLMTAGVGLFGTFTAYVSSWFLAGNKKETEE